MVERGLGREANAIRGMDARLLRLARLGAPVLAAGLLVVLAIGLAPGAEPGLDRSGAVLGHDLSQVWVAGRTALSGRGSEVYDVARHDAAVVELFGPAARFRWHYPPVYLLPAAALASMPYLAAVAAWAAGSLALFALAMRRATGRMDATIMALAHPLVFTSAGYGQNSLVTAALLTVGLTSLDRRPVLAGIAFGLVCYKPQLAGLAPLLCLLTGRWTCLLASAGSAALVAGGSAAAFGIEPWIAFVHSVPATNEAILRDAIAGLDLNASGFGAVRLLGGSVGLASAFQVAVSAAAIVATALVWRRTDHATLRAAATLMAAPLMSPYVPVYDLAPLVPGAVLLAMGARGGLTGAERAFLIGTVLLGAALRPAIEITGMPLGFGLAAVGFGLAIRRALGPRALGSSARPAAAGSPRPA